MESTSQDILFNLPCESFYLSIAQNPQLLSKGYQLVYKYLSISAKNRQSTLLHLLSQKSPILTLVTRVYPIVFCNNQLSISQQQKLNTKSYLIIELLLKNIIPKISPPSTSINTSNSSSTNPKHNIKNLNNFIRFLLNFHHNQGFEQWIGYYQKLLEQLVKNNCQFIGFILIELLKDSDDRVSCFSKHILKFIMMNQANIKITEEQSLEIVYYCIKSMAYLNGTDDQVINQYVQPFESQILKYIQTSISKSIKIMRYSLKILTVFAADYQLQFQKDLLNTIKQCQTRLIIQFLNLLQTSNQSNQQLQQNQQDYQQQQSTPSLSLLIYQMIELISTLLSEEQMKISDYPVYLTLCLPSLILSQHQYNEYSKSTDLYLVNLEDQHQKTLRNKAISFLLQLQQGQYPTKAKKKFKQQLFNYVFIILKSIQNQEQFAKSILSFYSQLGLNFNIQKYHLKLFEQSLTFLLYNLTEEILTTDVKQLEQNKTTIMQILGNKIKSITLIQSNQSNKSQENELLKVSYMNLLNKLIKSMNVNFKYPYYQFLLQQLYIILKQQPFINKGYLLSLCRGIAYISNDVPLTLTQQQNMTQKSIPIQLILSLITILLDPNNLQQSAHLILQFFVILIKKCQNSKQYLSTLLTSEIQMKILTNFIHDGTIVEALITLLGEIANAELIKYIYGQFLKGTAKQENLAELIAVWMENGMINISQIDIFTLLNVYKNTFVSKIIKQYLKQCKLKSLSISTQLSSILNKQILSCWILQMLSLNTLLNPQTIFLQTISNITYNLTSQYQIQSQLILPYYTFIKNPQSAINIIKSKNPQIYEQFINKLIRYAMLFQGSCLKIATANVMLNICEIDKNKINHVNQLIKSYGKVQNQEWEDEENQQEESAIDKMFNIKIVNDDVEKQFMEMFGSQILNIDKVHERLIKINSLLT